MMGRRVVFFLMVALLFAGSAFAQPDSTGKNQYDLVVKIGSSNEVVTVIRDAIDPDQWFYVPSRPRVVERNSEPVFSLVRYQAANAKDRSKLDQGAIVQFSVTMSIPPEAIDQINSKLASKLPAGAKIKLSALPFSECKIDLMKPNGEFLGESEEAKTITTTFGSSEVPFQIKLSTLGADVYADLCKNNTGIPVLVTYKYHALTPATQCTAKINYEQAFKHVSSSLDFQAQVGYAGSGISAGVNKEKIRELMSGDKGIKVEIIQASDKDQDFIDKCFQPILEKLYTELMDGPKFPPDFKADPAVAKSPPVDIIEQTAKAFENAPKTTNDAPVNNPTTGSGSGSGSATGSGSGSADELKKAAGGVAGALGALNAAAAAGQVKGQIRIGYAMKDIQKVRKGETFVDFRKRTVVEKTGGCGSFIGVGSYIAAKPELEKKLIRDLINSGWENAEFVMPKASDLKELGVQALTLTVSVVGKDKKQIEPEGKAQLLTYDPDKPELGWSKDGLTQTKLNFPLKSMFAKYTKEKVGEFLYKVVANIQVKMPGKVETFVITQYQPFITGDIAMSTPMSLLSTLQVDATPLNWDVAGKDKAQAVKIKLKAKYNKTDDKGALVPTTKDIVATISKANKDNPLSIQIPYGDDGKMAVVTGTIKCTVNGKDIVMTAGGKDDNDPRDLAGEGMLVLVPEWDADGIATNVTK